MLRFTTRREGRRSRGGVGVIVVLAVFVIVVLVLRNRLEVVPGLEGESIRMSYGALKMTCQQYEYMMNQKTNTITQ